MLIHKQYLNSNIEIHKYELEIILKNLTNEFKF